MFKIVDCDPLPSPLIWIWLGSAWNFVPSSATCWSFWFSSVLDPINVIVILQFIHWSKCQHLGHRLLKERRVLGHRGTSDCRWRRWSWRSRQLKGRRRRKDWWRHLEKQSRWRSRWRRVACFLLARLPRPEADLPEHPEERLLLRLFLLFRLQVHLHLLSLKLVVQLQKFEIINRNRRRNTPGSASAVSVSDLPDWFWKWKEVDRNRVVLDSFRTEGCNTPEAVFSVDLNDATDPTVGGGGGIHPGYEQGHDETHEDDLDDDSK